MNEEKTNKRKRTKKKKTTARKKKKKKTLPPLTNDQQQLIDDFEIIDRMWCFLSKRKALTTAKVIVQLARSAAKREITIERLKDIARRAPDVLTISKESTESCIFATKAAATHDDISVDMILMTTFKGAGKGHSIKRKKLFEACVRKQQDIDDDLKKQENEDSVIGLKHDLKTITKVDLKKPAELVEYLSSQEFYENQIVHKHINQRRNGKFVPTLKPKPPKILSDALENAIGIHQFYSHQADAIRAVRSGSHLVLSTCTGSGKSMAFNLPVLETILTNPDEACTALYLFPTKALAQDQLTALNKIVDSLPREVMDEILMVETLDGDTLHTERDVIRKWKASSILMSNPDLVHYSILPNHTRWAHQLSTLRYIVLDEAHVYRGVFGSHVALVLRRLLRLSRYLGANPQVLCFSATIENPTAHFEMLFPRSVWRRKLTVISKCVGTPQGSKTFLLWNPPLVHDVEDEKEKKVAKKKKKEVMKKKQNGEEKHKTVKEKVKEITISPSGFMPRGKQLPIHHAMPVNETPRRKSAIFETAKILAALVKIECRTLAFCATRKLTELVLRYTKDMLKETHPHLVNKVMSYRAGYTKQERYLLESKLKRGEIVALTSTNALELGVDLSGLHATIELGISSYSSMMQRAGRSGRNGKDSLSIVVCFDSPTDQFYAQRGEKLFERRGTPVVLDGFNPIVLRKHLCSAASEIQISVTDKTGAGAYFGGIEMMTALLCKMRTEEKNVREVSQGLWHGLVSTSTYPLRIIDNTSIEIMDISVSPPKLLSTIAFSRSFFECHKGAIYLHQGRQYLILFLDLDNLVARATPVNVNYYTASRDHTDVEILSRQKSNNFECYVGNARVETKVWGYRKIDLRTRRVYDMSEFSLPPLNYLTRALWITIPLAIVNRVIESKCHFLASIHAASHLILHSIRIHIACDRQDIGCVCINMNRKREFPLRLLVFDKNPGGVGIVDAVLPRLYEILKTALEIVKSCNCKDEKNGCPHCIQSQCCGEYNYVLEKRGSKIILEYILKRFGKDNDEEEEQVASIRPHHVFVAPSSSSSSSTTTKSNSGRGTTGFNIREHWVDSVPMFTHE